MAVYHFLLLANLSLHFFREREMKKIALLISMLVSSSVMATPTYTIKQYNETHGRGAIPAQIPASAKWQSYVGTDASIPQSADISASVSLPENQGTCGACWDFSLTKALRSEYMTRKVDPGVLEFNYLLNNCGPGPRMSGCNGGSFQAAQSFLHNAGPGLNALNPYTGKDHGRCIRQPVAATAVSYVMLGKRGGHPTFQDLAYAVGVDHHMVSIDVASSTGDWDKYSSGIYNGCKGKASDIDHMVDLVGYDCQTSVDSNGNCAFNASGRPINGDGYLIVENNWGEDWGTTAASGHNGYMKTVMYGSNGRNCNAIATNALVFNLSQ